MKCPKCSYLGFDTGDRCKNCGYDFSLIVDASTAGDVDLDLTLRSSDDDNLPVAVQWDDTFWDGTLDGTTGALPSSPGASDPVLPVPEPTTARAEPVAAEVERADPRLPLLTQMSDDVGDEPLIKLPATPRPPLAVHRTPRTPRLRTVPKASRPFAMGPTLEFWDRMPEAPAVESVSEVRARTAARLARPSQQGDVTGAARRLGAAAIDHLLLSVIDLSVIYFTLRMAGLPMAEWTALPPVPLVVFLLLVKLSYFSAFTAVGGQTIGKMAARIRVVTKENASVDGACALKRALAGAVSASVLGLGYLPALVGSEHLALHDYVTHTRVIALPSA